MTTYEYKKAPLGRRVRLTIDDQGASLGQVDGASCERVEWSSVTGIRYGEITARRMTSRWLDLSHPGGRFRLPCNTHRSADARTGDLKTYRSAVAALARTLEEHRPELDAYLGTGKAMTWAYFLMGAAAIAAGVGIPLVAWLTGRPSYKILPGLAPSSMLIFVGILIVSGFAPWRKRTPIPLGDFAQLHGG